MSVPYSFCTNEYHKPQRGENANEVLKQLRTLRISLDDEQKQEVASVYGSYNEFRKKNMGRIIFTDDGTPLDTQWQELSAMYPAFFDSIITNERLARRRYYDISEAYKSMHGV